MPDRTSPARVAVVAALLLGATPLAMAELNFQEVGVAAGVRFAHEPLGYVQTSGAEFQNHSGPGATFFDVNRDGWLDLIIADGFPRGQGHSAGSHVCLNNGDGTFVDASPWYGIRTGNVSNVVLAADVDNDGASDVILTNHFHDPDLLRSDSYRLRNFTAASGLPYLFFSQPTKPENYVGPRTTGAALGDYNNDGWLDFFMVNQGIFRDRLARNAGGGYYEPTYKIFPRSACAGFQPVFFDYDGDGDQDIYQVNDGMRNFLYRNEGGPNWEFTEMAEALHIQGGYVYADPTTMGMGCAVADFDNDLDEDVYVTNFRINALYENPGDWGAGGRRVFTDVATEKGVAWDWNGWACDFFDADNDGDLDLYLVNGWVEGALEPRQRDTYLNPNVLYRNNGPPSFDFSNVSAAAGVDDPQVGRGLTVGDYDRDGDLDMYVTNNTYYNSFLNPYPSTPEYRGTHLLYRNDTVTENHWINVRLEGAGEHQSGSGCNRDAVGVRAFLSAGGKTQLGVVRAGSGYMGQMSLELEFGLGAATEVDELRVEWTCGAQSSYHNLAADRFYHLHETTGITLADEVFTLIEASPSTQGMHIAFRTQASFDGSQVELHRRAAQEADFLRLAVSPHIKGGGAEAYDASAVAGQRYEYFIVLIDNRGVAHSSVPISAEMRLIVPRKIVLHPSTPNPFNPQTTLRFELPSAMRVRLEIFDARGQRVRQIAHREFPAGQSQVDFDGNDDSGKALASGVYYFSLFSEAGSRSRKLSLVR